jgi:hypothetical protein
MGGGDNGRSIQVEGLGKYGMKVVLRRGGEERRGEGRDAAAEEGVVGGDGDGDGG